MFLHSEPEDMEHELSTPMQLVAFQPPVGVSGVRRYGDARASRAGAERARDVEILKEEQDQEVWLSEGPTFVTGRHPTALRSVRLRLRVRPVRGAPRGDSKSMLRTVSPWSQQIDVRSGSSI